MTRLLLIAATLLTAGFADAALRRICYHTNWAQYRNGAAKFFPENIDPSLCTHVIYSFAKMAGNKLTAFEWNDESTAWMKGMYERFDAIKQSNPSVKTLLAVGGWNMGSAPFTAMVASDAGINEFATTSIKFLRDHNFDGLDMDWEYPANRGSPAGDKARYVQLLKSLRAAFHSEAQTSGKTELLLSAAVPAGKSNIDTGFDVPAVAKELDFINLMTYDLHGSWESFTGHNAPLHARASETGNQTNLNVEWATKYWASLGAPKEKMNIGVPLYGRTFKLSYGQNDKTIGCAANGAGPAGTATREAGFLAYHEICQDLSHGATKMYDSEGMVPYYSKGDMWCGYDDPASLKEKVKYIKSEGFGGVMVWALDLDDFSGSCPGGQKYPLMHAIIDQLNDPTGQAPATAAPVTQAPVTAAPVTQAPVTAAPVTAAPVTAAPVTAAPVTAAPVTAAPVTQAPVTQGPIVTTKTPITQAPAVITQAPATSPPASSGNHHDLTLVSNSEFDCSQKADGYYPSMTSCTDYYICASKMAFRTDCHPGLQFNPTTQYCDFSDHVTCAATNPAPVTSAPVTAAPVTAAPVTAAPVTAAPVTAAPVTAAPTTAAPSVTKYPGSVHPADFCKGKSDGFYSDPMDCGHFYQCSFEVSYHETCPSGTYFNPAMKGCDWADRVPNCP